MAGVSVKQMRGSSLVSRLRLGRSHKARPAHLASTTVADVMAALFFPSPVGAAAPAAAPARSAVPPGTPVRVSIRDGRAFAGTLVATDPETGSVVLSAPGGEGARTTLVAGRFIAAVEATAAAVAGAPGRTASPMVGATAAAATRPSPPTTAAAAAGTPLPSATDAAMAGVAVKEAAPGTEEAVATAAEAAVARLAASGVPAQWGGADDRAIHVGAGAAVILGPSYGAAQVRASSPAVLLRLRRVLGGRGGG